MDKDSYTDAYVKFYFGGLDIKTKIVKESLNPIFN